MKTTSRPLAEKLIRWLFLAAFLAVVALGGLAAEVPLILRAEATRQTEVALPGIPSSIFHTPTLPATLTLSPTFNPSATLTPTLPPSSTGTSTPVPTLTPTPVVRLPCDRPGWFPKKFGLKDHSVFSFGQSYYMVSTYLPTAHRLAMARSPDLCNWEELPPILTQYQQVAWDGMAVWSPFVYEESGVYYLFYTGVTCPRE
jgi:hypothetical protein